MRTATHEQIKRANCEDEHSSGHKGCKKYQEVTACLNGKTAMHKTALPSTKLSISGIWQSA